MRPQVTVHAIERDAKNDTAQQWNFDVQRELPGGIVLQGAYVGTHGTHLFMQRNINYPHPTGDGRFVRPYVGYGQIWYQSNNGNSIYHSGQFTVQKRFSDGPTSSLPILCRRRLMMPQVRPATT